MRSINQPINIIVTPATPCMNGGSPNPQQLHTSEKPISAIPRVLDYNRYQDAYTDDPCYAAQDKDEHVQSLLAQESVATVKKQVKFRMKMNLLMFAVVLILTALGVASILHHEFSSESTGQVMQREKRSLHAVASVAMPIESQAMLDSVRHSRSSDDVPLPIRIAQSSNQQGGWKNVLKRANLPLPFFKGFGAAAPHSAPVRRGLFAQGQVSQPSTRPTMPHHPKVKVSSVEETQNMMLRENQARLSKIHKRWKVTREVDA